MPQNGSLAVAFLKEDEGPLGFRSFDNSNVIRRQSGFHQAAQLGLAEIVVADGADVSGLQTKAGARGDGGSDLASGFKSNLMDGNFGVWSRKAIDNTDGVHRI